MVNRLFLFEIFSILVGFVLVVSYIQANPFLASSSADAPIGLLNERESTTGTLSILKGQTAYGPFNYTSFDPPILLLDLTYLNSNSTGYLDIYCNGRFVANLIITPGKSTERITIVSCAGTDWTKDRSDYSTKFENSFDFVSDQDYGYEGAISYKVSIRGSR